MLRKNMPGNRERKQREAKERQEAHVALTLDQQLEKLDAYFGKGMGARKERARKARLHS